MATHNPLVLVDLGNVHDCLKRLIPLADAGDLSVVAYADLAFNGFGVNPPVESANCVVKRATSADKNAADVELAWDVAQRCLTASEPMDFVVATRDHGFRHLQSLAARSGHTLRFVQDWPSLRGLLVLHELSPLGECD